jgi:hypothetical protein
MWTELVWVRIMTNGGILRTLSRVFQFPKMQGISSLCEQLLAPQEEFHSVLIVTFLFMFCILFLNFPLCCVILCQLDRTAAPTACSSRRKTQDKWQQRRNKKNVQDLKTTFCEKNK